MIEQQIVGEQVAGESIKVRKELEELIKNYSKSTFDIAELLHKVKRTKAYYPEFETFGDYVRTLDIKQRKSQYLERIVDVCTQLEIPRNTYEPVGISKLREITSLDPSGTWVNPKDNKEYPLKDFVTEMIHKAPELSLDSIKQHVKTLKGLVGENDIENITFGWTKDTMDKTIKPALEMAARNLGSSGRDEEGNAIEPSKSKCVEIWAIEYLNEPQEEK